ncbi:unnamed protein product [Staurois parvus]|uniref:Uncharacterized protein n=1 Tax=Staurois parvus TaxID=386267 RepID=A0ABN9EQ50_9NEOB|nr:unnamed protein product [Staurois parvus]
MPLVPFIGFFGLWARTQGLHDPLLPGGPMSCQSAPGFRPWSHGFWCAGTISFSQAP